MTEPGHDAKPSESHEGRGQGMARDSRAPGPAMPPRVIRVLVADDHPVFREGLVALLDRQPDLAVVGQASDGRAAVELFDRLAPDVGIIDLKMPVLGGIAVIAAIRARSPQARLVILTSFAGDEDIDQALRAGARGYLVKDASGEEVIDCLRAVHEGRTCLPPAVASRLAGRAGVSELTAQGKGNREIGTTLDVTEGTVKVHVNNILTKLGVASRTEAVNIGIRRRLVRIDE